MVTEPKEILKRVTSSDADIQFDGVRSLKNEIIGNPNRKQCFIQLGAVPKIVRILAQPQEPRLAIQAAAALGSFAYGNEDGVEAIVKSGGVAHLLKTLSSEDCKLMEAGLRSLKMIFQESAQCPRETVFVSPAFDRLVSFLDYDEHYFAEDSLTVLFNCCKSKAQQELLLKSGALGKILKLLFSSKSSNQHVAVDGLAIMCRSNEEVCSQVSKQNEAIRRLLRFCKTQTPQLQLTACIVLTSISTTSSTFATKPAPFNEELVSVLVRLIEEPSVSDQVPGIMAELALHRKNLQQMIYDAGVFQKLLRMMEDQSPCGLTALTGVIKVIGVLCQYLPNCRTQLKEYGGIFRLLKNIESEIREIKEATLFCLEAIVSGSSEQEAANKADAYITKPPIPYSNDPENRLKELACATLWLLYMDNPAALKKSPENEFQLLLRCAQDVEVSVQHKAIWALSNIIASVEEMTYEVIISLPWSHLVEMARNPSHQVQEVGLRWLKVLCEQDNFVGSVVGWSNGQLPELISEKLKAQNSPSTEVLRLTMDVAVAVASSDVEHQNLMVGSAIPAHLLDCLEKCESEEVRQRAVDCVIKLTYKDVLPCLGEDGEVVEKRKTYLLELGFEETLRKLSESGVSDTLKKKIDEALSYLVQYDFDLCT